MTKSYMKPSQLDKMAQQFYGTTRYKTMLAHDSGFSRQHIYNLLKGKTSIKQYQAIAFRKLLTSEELCSAPPDFYPF